MQIFVKGIQGQNVLIKIDPSFTVQMIKKIIAQKISINPDDFFLTSNKQCCREDRAISTYGISQHQTLRMVGKMKGGEGGGYNSIKFNSLQETIHERLVKRAPKWRQVDFGLNLQGVCRNRKCRAYEEQVWVNKGYGQFNMSKQVYVSRCPMCNDFVDDVFNLALFIGKANCYGKKSDQKQPQMSIFRHHDRSNFLTFLEDEMNIINWDFLQIKCESFK